MCRQWLAAPLDPALAMPLVPSRVEVGGTDDRIWAAAAMEAIRRDGAVVLSGLLATTEDFRELARQLPARLFGGAGLGAPVLLSHNAPVNAVHEELLEAKTRGLYLPGSGLLPHTDGYVYGDDMPDFVFLVCEQPSSRGGNNVLLDGEAMLAALEADGESGRELAAWLAAKPVDLSEPSDTGIAPGRAAEGPVVQRHTTSSGRVRLKWRRQINVKEAQQLNNWRPLGPIDNDTVAAVCVDAPSERYLSLWRPLPSDNVADAEWVRSHLHRLDALLQRAGAVAFAEHGFSLGRGDALVVDNYRVLHGRTPYLPASLPNNMQEALGLIEPERRLWRVWSWTSEGSGLPPDGAQSSHPLNDDVFNSHLTNVGHKEAEL